MGTGRTRSQSRQTRSANPAAVKGGDISSPLEAIHGNHLTHSSRRQPVRTRNSSTMGTSSEKENAPPSPTKGLVNKLAVKSKARQKRQDRRITPGHSKRVCNNSDHTKDKNEEGDKAAETVRTARLSPNRRAANLVSVLVKGTEFEMKSNNTCGAAQSEINFQANLATDAEKETLLACKTRNRHQVPIAPGASSGQDMKEKGPLQITESGLKVEGAIPSTSPLLLLQKAIDKFYSKYQKLKARKFDEVNAQFEDQNSRIRAYVNATEALVEHYKGENRHLRQQLQETNIPELFTTFKILEKTNVECRNELLLEQSKNLELQQEIKRLKSSFSKDTIGRSNGTDLGPDLSLKVFTSFVIDTRKNEEKSPGFSSGTKLMQQLLECLVGLKLSFCAEGVTEFQHPPTGFKFSLRTVHDTDIAELVGGGELVYQNVSLGTLCKKTTGWMKEEEAIFGMAQVQFLFKTLRRLLQQGA